MGGSSTSTTLKDQNAGNKIDDVALESEVGRPHTLQFTHKLQRGRMRMA